RSFGQWVEFLLPVAARFITTYGLDLFLNGFGPGDIAQLLRRIVVDVLQEKGIDQDVGPSPGPSPAPDSLPSGRTYRIAGTIQILDGDIEPVSPQLQPIAPDAIVPENPTGD